MKILLLGSSSQLAKCFCDLFKQENFESFEFYSTKVSSIADFKKYRIKFQDYNPTFIINCIAYTNVELAEKQKKELMLINFKFVKFLAQECQKQKIKLIHFSTDYVFDGKKGCPYIENDIPNPINLYGQSKLNGENAILESKSESIIIRTSWLYSSYGNNFLKKIIYHGQTKDSINIVDDEFGNPTSADELARCVFQLLLNWGKLKDTPKIFHISGSEGCNWFQFTKYIFDISKRYGFKINAQLNPISAEKYMAKVIRPKVTYLATNKFISFTEYKFLSLESNIESTIRKLKNEKSCNNNANF